MLRRLVPAVLAGALLAACGGPAIEDFRDTEPRFVPEEYFPGQTRVWGIFQDRFGKVRRQFVVDIDGRWDGEVLTLEEDFRFDDGETTQRTWRIRKLADGRYEATAGDVIGTGTATALGQAFNLNYDIELPIGDDTWQVRFDDWLLLQPDGVVINRAYVTKFGVRIAEMTAFFRKLDPE